MYISQILLSYTEIRDQPTDGFVILWAGGA